MHSDLEILKELEKELGIELKPLERFEFFADIGYMIDEGNNVIGISLSFLEGELSDISILRYFRNLTHLDLSGNSIEDISFLKYLQNLTHLNLSYHDITDISAIEELRNLEQLYLIEIGVEDISVVRNLRNLNYLNLGYNRLKDIKALKELRNLTHLDLSGNSLSFIQLDLNGNRLKDISILKYLENLTYLNLSDNDLKNIPVLKYLTNLTYLNLSNNRITDISVLKNLRNLTYLDLSNNHLTDISVLKKLSKLKSLDLSYNEILRIPQEFLNLNIELGWEKDEHLGGSINLYRNPLESPPIEIVKKGRKAVIEYFKSLEGEKEALNEVKVLLVGDGGAGKTSLVKQLIGEKFDKNESETHGINIIDWQVEEADNSIKSHFWDFGGQEIMHATHQFFLSKRSLYILVLDGRKDEKTEYWLKHIESFGGDSPILVVLNKIDENPGFDLNRRFLQDKYKGIRGFYRVSCATGAGIKLLSENLNNALANVEILETTWAKSWFNVKTQLENMTEDFISYEEYKALCANENITKKTSQDTLVDFLNDLGVILHFKELQLLDTHVLNPKWVTNAVYKIINSEKLALYKGVLKLQLLDEILKKKGNGDYYYPPEKYSYIIDLMKKFELCYEIDRRTVLIPDLLEVQEPEFDFDYDGSLKFLIEYDFLPKSVMPRFIVKMHKDIKENLRWRTGVVLEDKAFHSTAVIKADERDEKIYIYVNGEQKRDYFAVILFTFREINRSFEKLKAIEKVPMPDEPEITVSYEHLVRLERKGIEKYIPDGSEKEYNVKDLLGTVYVEKRNEEEILEILRKLRDESDTEESLLKKANDTFILQPNVMGVGINFNKLIKKVLSKKE